MTGGEQIVIGVRGIAPNQEGELVEGGHALWPLRITRDDAAETDILVYDCNHPGGVNEVAFDAGEVCVLRLFKANGEYTGWSYHMWYGLDWGSGRENAHISWMTPLDRRDVLFDGKGFSTGFYLFLVDEGVLVEGEDFSCRLYPSATGRSDKVVPVLNNGLLLDENGKAVTSADCPDLYWVDSGNTVRVSEIDGDGRVGIASANSSVVVKSAAGSELDLTVGDDVRSSAAIM